MSKQLLLLLIILLFCKYSRCQENDYHIKRNVIKGSVASSGIYNGMISIDYERNLMYAEYIKLNIEGTYGKYYQIHIKQAFQSYPIFNSVTFCINLLMGRKSHFFEAGLGVRYSIIKVDYYDDIDPLFPALNIGYRYHNHKKKGLIFRTFLGTTGVGLSVGIAF